MKKQITMCVAMVTMIIVALSGMMLTKAKDAREKLVEPNYSFSETTKVLTVNPDQEQIYVVEGKIYEIPVSANDVSVKLGDASVVSAVSSNKVELCKNKEDREKSTYDYENGYARCNPVILYGEGVGTTSMKLFEKNDTAGNPLGQVVEVNVVEPSIETDAEDSYIIKENETIEFTAKYFGEVYWEAVEGNDECIEVGGDSAGKVTITGQKCGEVKIIMFDDNIGPYTEEATPKSKVISIKVQCRLPMETSTQSISLQTGGEKVISLFTHKGCSYPANVVSGNEIIATVKATNVMDYKQRVTVTAVNDWKSASRDLQGVLELKCQCDLDHVIRIPIAVHNTNLYVAPTPVATPTPVPDNKSVKVTQKAKTISGNKGKTKKISSYLKIANNKKVSKITYKSSNKKIVTVSSKGKVSLKKKGTAKVYVTITFKDKTKKKLTYKIKVK